MKIAALCLCLPASSVQAACIDLLPPGLSVVVDDDFQLTADGSEIILQRSPGRPDEASISLIPLDVFGFVGGEILENGFSLSIRDTEVKPTGDGASLATLRGLMMTPLPRPLVFDVTCSRKGTGFDPSWCVSLIETMRETAGGCAMRSE